MAPQTQIPVAANVLGTVSRLADHWHKFWCVQLVPQIWTNWRRKNTDGLPALMMFLWAVCGVPFGAYSIIQKFNMPIQVQPQCFMALSLTCWVQILIYSAKLPAWTAILIGLGTAAVFAGVETGLIIGLRPLYDNGNNASVIAVGTIASVLLAAGLIPPYFEIYKRRGRVVGINFVFLSMDWCGAFFSLMAVAVQNTFDVLGGIIYIVCAFLEIGIFMSHAIWLLRTRKLRRQAKAEGKTYDEILAERVAVEGAAYPFAERELHACFSASWWARKFSAVVRRRAAATGGEEETSADVESADAASEKQPASDHHQRDSRADKETAPSGSEKTETSPV